MPTTTARILQSTGLNANKSSIAARELGITSDTEQPVIGSTVGGAKYLGTEELISVVTAAPAAIPILRRSAVSIWCDTTSAGASIALDIRNGAQVAGYRVMVFTVGTDARQTVVQYATGVLDYVPAGCSQEFLWNGSAWIKIHQSYADKYLMGDMLQLPDKPTISAKMPLVDRSVDNDLSSTNYPTFVSYFRGIKASILGTTDFSVNVVGSVITFPNNAAGIAAVKLVVEDALVSGWLNGNQAATFSADYATAASQRTINIAGTDYVITGASLSPRTITVTGTPASGAQTAILYTYRTAVSTIARLHKIAGFVGVVAGDADGYVVGGWRKMDEGQGHWHDVSSSGGLYYEGTGSSNSGSGGGFVLSRNLVNGGTASARTIQTNTVDGTPRTGKTTDPRTIGQYTYTWAGVYVV